MDLDDTLIALADDTRRSILKRLAAGEARVTEVARPSTSRSTRSPSTSACSSARDWCAGASPAATTSSRSSPSRSTSSPHGCSETREFWTSRLDHLEAALRAETPSTPARKHAQSKEKQMNARLPSTLVEPGTVRLERLLPGPVERVWAYITESDKRANWLAGGEFDLRVGGKIRLEFDNARLSSEKTPPGEVQGHRRTGTVRGRHHAPRAAAPARPYLELGRRRDRGHLRARAARQGRAAHHRAPPPHASDLVHERHGRLGRAHRHPRRRAERRRAAALLDDARPSSRRSTGRR